MVTSKEELIQRLKHLPDEKKREYEKTILALAMDDREIDPEKRKELHHAFAGWVDELMGSPTDLPLSAEEEKVAFGAFYIRVNQLRRNEDRSQEYELLRSYKDRFREHPLLNHLYVMCLLDIDPVGNAKKILDKGYKNMQEIPHNAGVYHVLAIAVADIFEATEFQPELQPDSIWLQRGEDAAREALELDDGYAKFHCTMGRLLPLKGEFSTALAEISQAIDLENSNHRDYALRISGYRMYYQRIQDKQRSESMQAKVQVQIDEAKRLTEQIRASIQETEKKQQQLEEETRNSLTKNMEFLGLFAGIVSFTIGGISIASAMAERSFVGAAGLLVVLMGALLCVFAGFGVILHGYRGDKSRRNIVVLLFGAGMILLGVFLCWKQ